MAISLYLSLILFFDWLDIISNIGDDMVEKTLAFANVLTMGRYRSRRDKLGAVIGALIGAFLHEFTQIA